MRDLPQFDGYDADPRDDVRPFIPVGCTSVLDIGCGPGGFGPTLRQALGPHARISGVEAMTKSAERARATRSYDHVYDGYFPEALTEVEARFDLICFNDVLEHILDPLETVCAARDRLTPTGSILAAIPNVQYAPVVLGLARGRWAYTDDGILDRTHVRFFTKSTMLDLFADANMKVTSIQGANSLQVGYDTDPNRARRALKRLGTRLMGNAQYLHFVVTASV